MGMGRELRFAGVPQMTLNSTIFPGMRAVCGETALGSNISCSRCLHPAILGTSSTLFLFGSPLSKHHLLFMARKESLRAFPHQGAVFNGLTISQWKRPEAHSFGGMMGIFRCIPVAEK